MAVRQLWRARAPQIHQCDRRTGWSRETNVTFLDGAVGTCHPDAGLDTSIQVTPFFTCYQSLPVLDHAVLSYGSLRAALASARWSLSTGDLFQGRRVFCVSVSAGVGQ
jgi:hypothetical protein